jgi:hypothetical protein
MGTPRRGSQGRSTPAQLDRKCGSTTIAVRTGRFSGRWRFRPRSGQLSGIRVRRPRHPPGWLPQRGYRGLRVGQGLSMGLSAKRLVVSELCGGRKTTRVRTEDGVLANPHPGSAGRPQQAGTPLRGRLRDCLRGDPSKKLPQTLERGSAREGGDLLPLAEGDAPVMLLHFAVHPQCHRPLCGQHIGVTPLGKAHPDPILT